MDYLLQLAEYKINNSTESTIKFFKLKDIIQSCIKNTKSQLYHPDSTYPFADEKNIFILYSLTPLQLSNTLTNTIFEVYSKYVSMSTLLVDKEFIINVDNENIIYVVLFVPLLETNRYTLPNSLIKSMIFKKIYKVSEYVKIDQDTLHSFLKKCKKDLVIGGGGPTYASKEEKSLIKTTIIKEIYESIKGNKDICDHVLFLSFIEELCTGETIDFSNTLNLITTNETVQQEIIQLFTTILKKDPNYALKIKKHEKFYIPNDFRLSKINLYIEFKTKKMEKIYLCNIFNEGTYDVLPCTNRFGIWTPSKLVVLRFLYLDLFFIERVKTFGEHLQDRIKKIIEFYKDEDNTIVWKGIYKNERSDKIITNLKCNKDLTIYRPWEYLELHKKLRHL